MIAPVIPMVGANPSILDDPCEDPIGVNPCDIDFDLCNGQPEIPNVGACNASAQLQICSDGCPIVETWRIPGPLDRALVETPAAYLVECEITIDPTLDPWPPDPSTVVIPMLMILDTNTCDDLPNPNEDSYSYVTKSASVLVPEEEVPDVGVNEVPVLVTKSGSCTLSYQAQIGPWGVPHQSQTIPCALPVG